MTDSKKNLEWQLMMGADETISKNNDGLINFKKEEKKLPITENINQVATSNSGEMSYNQILEYANQLAEKCHDLKTLHETIKNFEYCDLKKNATNTVLCNKYEPSEIMLIGEAPGANEDIQGVPFCGDSGKLIEKMFEYIGYPRDKLFITNSVFWRPPGNRRPTRSEIEMCRPFIFRTIKLVNPKMIILVGATSLESILDRKEPMSFFRRKILQQKIPTIDREIPITSVFHPAYLLRQPAQKKIAWFDLLFIKKFMNNL